MRTGSNMPFARGLIADISDPERLALFVYNPDAPRPSGNGGQRRVETAPLATGTFGTPAPPEWSAAAVAANNIIIISGPAIPADYAAAGALVFTRGAHMAVVPLGRIEQPGD